jgi:hypothetical protein
MFRVIFTLFVGIVVAYIFLASLSGCSSHRTTSETTPEVETGHSGRERYSRYLTEPRFVERAEISAVEAAGRFTQRFMPHGQAT